MFKIGVIGDKDSILGFKSVGFSIFPVKNSCEAEKLLHELAEQQFAVIYVTEQIAADIMNSVELYNDKNLPAIILIPGNQGSLGLGMQGVKKTVEKAVGADILFKDKD
jgi:V/A-type H+/Na+-transporting ATPase subunit F